MHLSWVFGYNLQQLIKHHIINRLIVDEYIKHRVSDTADYF